MQQQNGWRWAAGGGGAVRLLVCQLRRACIDPGARVAGGLCRTAASRGHPRIDDDEDDEYNPAPSKRPGSQRVAAPAAKAKSRPGGAQRPAAKVGRPGSGAALRVVQLTRLGWEERSVVLGFFCFIDLLGLVYSVMIGSGGSGG
jgi:hypothetical protein